MGLTEDIVGRVVDAALAAAEAEMQAEGIPAEQTEHILAAARSRTTGAQAEAVEAIRRSRALAQRVSANRSR